MKKMYMVIVALVLCGILMGVVACAQAETYPAALMVVDLDEHEDMVIAVDFNGNEWTWTGIEDIFPGDMIAVVMDDQGTETIYDDEIIDLRYCGWIEGWMDI
jgi:hypothetical protein